MAKQRHISYLRNVNSFETNIKQNAKKTLFVLVSEVVTFNLSMRFNVKATGQKVTVYEGTVGLDVTRNKATGEEMYLHRKKLTERSKLGLFCQITC